MTKVLVGCCGWSYGDLAEKGVDWSVLPRDKYEKTTLLFQVLRDSYEKFYKYVTPATFRGMANFL